MQRFAETTNSSSSQSTKPAWISFDFETFQGSCKCFKRNLMKRFVVHIRISYYIYIYLQHIFVCFNDKNIYIYIAFFVGSFVENPYLSPMPPSPSAYRSARPWQPEPHRRQWEQRAFGLGPHGWLGRRGYFMIPFNKGLPSRGLTYPTWGKGKSSSKCHFWGIC